MEARVAHKGWPNMFRVAEQRGLYPSDVPSLFAFSHGGLPVQLVPSRPDLECDSQRHRPNNRAMIVVLPSVAWPGVLKLLNLLPRAISFIFAQN